ncbi:hypothetical protein [Streptomyces sp. NPDC012825]|uniref:hypothetical protein n=1 Tax=Streptomyces sp. NPDC012825 TaxID=3364851 RepID=UPI0036C2CD33
MAHDVSERRDGHHVERLVAEAGRETAVEAPFTLKLDPGVLVAPRAEAGSGPLTPGRPPAPPRP